VLVEIIMNVVHSKKMLCPVRYKLDLHCRLPGSQTGRTRAASLNAAPPCCSPSPASARRSPCTWPAGGPRRTCPPDWAAGGPAARRGWTAAGSTTGRGRAPSWPTPRPDTPGPRRRTAGSWTTGWWHRCRRCSGTDLREERSAVRTNAHRQKRHIPVVASAQEPAGGAKALERAWSGRKVDSWAYFAI